MIALLLAVLGASLLGSLHCVAMCGGLAAVVATAPGGRRLPTAGAAPRASSRAGAHLLYALGRGASYTLAGALAGALGAGLDLAGELAGLQRAAAIAGGALLILLGVASLCSAAGRAAAPSGAAARVVGAALRAGRGAPLLVGLATPLLPCGWLWLFVVTAASSGGAARGAAVLAAFWLGTVPALLGLGLGLERLARAAGPRLPRALPWARAATLVVVGALTLGSRGVALPQPAAPSATQVAPTASEAPALDAAQASVTAARAARPACCHE